MGAPEQLGPASEFVVTSNRGFAAWGHDELRAILPGATFEPLIPGETYLMRAPYPRDVVIREIADYDPIFVRHLHPADVQIMVSGGVQDMESIADAVMDRFRFSNGEKIAVQVRKAEGVSLDYSPGDVRLQAAERIVHAYAAETVAKDADRIVSIFIGQEKAYLGVSAPADNLSDWAGGAMRFKKEEGQVSRAKFKLLEAERTFGLDFSACRTALDIGAAPGGWSSLLLERGVQVTAVDPAEMHPDLLRHPNLTHLRRKASEVHFPEHAFDLLVCDMSWSPKMMVKSLVPLLAALRPGGDAVITLKLMHAKPFRTLKETVRAMDPPMRLLRAKQLFHNRDEMTMLLKKND